MILSPYFTILQFITNQVLNNFKINELKYHFFKPVFLRISVQTQNVKNNVFLNDLSLFTNQKGTSISIQLISVSHPKNKTNYLFLDKILMKNNLFNSL